MSRELKILFGLGLGAVAWYAVGLWNTIRHLDWTFSNFQIYRIDKHGLDFLLKLNIDNTTGSRSISIRGARFKMYIDDQFLSTVRVDKSIYLQSGTTKQVEIHIALRWMQFSRLLLEAVSDSTVKITAQGVVNIGGVTANTPKIELTNVNITQEIKAVKENIIASGEQIASWFGKGATA